jgi:hypothetical protein
MEGVYCAVRTESLHIFQVNLIPHSFKRQRGTPDTELVSILRRSAVLLVGGVRVAWPVCYYSAVAAQATNQRHNVNASSPAMSFLMLIYS